MLIEVDVDDIRKTRDLAQLSSTWSFSSDAEILVNGSPHAPYAAIGSQEACLRFGERDLRSGRDRPTAGLELWLPPFFDDCHGLMSAVLGDLTGPWSAAIDTLVGIWGAIYNDLDGA